MELAGYEPDIDDELLTKFVIDCAQGIHRYSTIAERYGLNDEATLMDYLTTHPAVRDQIRKYKAAFNSDLSVTDRVRLKAGLAAEDLIPYIALRCKSGDTPISQAIDGFHKLLRAAGTDGPVSGGANGTTGGGGTAFNLSIVFSNGENVKISAQPPLASEDYTEITE
jgi:hypothetical protein